MRAVVDERHPEGRMYRGDFGFNALGGLQIDLCRILCFAGKLLSFVNVSLLRLSRNHSRRSRNWFYIVDSVIVHDVNKCAV
jgi:hypothetical protein